MRTQILQEHVVLQRFPRHVGARMGVDVDQPRDQPAAIVNELRPGDGLEGDSVTIQEHQTLDAVGQAPTAHAQRHSPSPRTEQQPRPPSTHTMTTPDLPPLVVVLPESSASPTTTTATVVTGAIYWLVQPFCVAISPRCMIDGELEVLVADARDAVQLCDDNGALTAACRWGCCAAASSSRLPERGASGARDADQQDVRGTLRRVLAVVAPRVPDPAISADDHATQPV